MPAPIPAEERLKRARELVDLARKELEAIPPRGRERTYIITRNRRRIAKAFEMLIVMTEGRRSPRLEVTPGQEDKAKKLIAELEELWPGADYRRERPYPRTRPYKRRPLS